MSRTRKRLLPRDDSSVKRLSGVSPTNSAPRRCIVIHPTCLGLTGRDSEARLQEAIGLAEAIDLTVEYAEVVSVNDMRPATLFGTGTVERLAHVLNGLENVNGESGKHSPEVVIVDRALTPVQQRNLERAWKTKVVDRTGLILEIFGERARTAEGELQVELAALTYQRSRLVRSWTHLERQRGGFGFFGGPGESQLETDRRLIRDRIARIKKELQQVRRTRALHRRARQRVPYAVVAIVGYTNAGKSTLFNRLTRSTVDARDMLFATLDPTMRATRLPSGRTIILSDTVGFISDLPHELIEAFRATLEEVTAADLILHVRDASHPNAGQQKEDVEEVLRNLGLVTTMEAGSIIEVMNKIDLLTEDDRLGLENRCQRSRGSVVALSAGTGDGLEGLLSAIDEHLSRSTEIINITLMSSDGENLAWLYRHGEVLQRENDEGEMHLQVRLSPSAAARFAQRQHAGGEALPVRATDG